MAPDAPESPSEGNAHRLGEGDILRALRAATDHAFIEEQEVGQFIIDGKFDLRVVADRLSEMSRTQPA